MLVALISESLPIPYLLAAQWPPIHPMLVNFTAALVPASFLFDALGAWKKNESLRAAGWYALLLAACITPLTILFGWLWMEDMDHWQMPIHQWLGTSLGVLLIALAVWRGRLHRQNHPPRAGYATVAGVLLLAFMFQGELGASMSFGRGVILSSEEHADEDHDHASEASHDESSQPHAADAHESAEHDAPEHSH